MLVEKITSLQKNVSILIIKKSNRNWNPTSQSEIENKEEYDMANDTNTMQPIIKTASVLLVAQLTHLKKWLLAKHIKYIHPEERWSNSSDKNYDQPQIEDQIRHNEYIKKSFIHVKISH